MMTTEQILKMCKAAKNDSDLADIHNILNTLKMQQPECKLCENYEEIGYCIFYKRYLINKIENCNYFK